MAEVRSIRNLEATGGVGVEFGNGFEIETCDFKVGFYEVAVGITGLVFCNLRCAFGRLGHKLNIALFYFFFLMPIIWDKKEVFGKFTIVLFSD
jgi:hypothetical protein